MVISFSRIFDIYFNSLAREILRTGFGVIRFLYQGTQDSSLSITSLILSILDYALLKSYKIW